MHGKANDNQRLRLHAASVKWRDQLLFTAVLVESEQHVAVCSSDQPEIEHVLGRHKPSSIPKARSHMNSDQLAGQGFGKLLEIMRSSVKVS